MTTQAATPWLTTPQLAERWQTTEQALLKLRHLGKTPRAIKIGKSLRWHIDDVTAFETQRREASA